MKHSVMTITKIEKSLLPLLQHLWYALLPPLAAQYKLSHFFETITTNNFVSTYKEKKWPHLQYFREPPPLLQGLGHRSLDHHTGFKILGHLPLPLADDAG